MNWTTSPSLPDLLQGGKNRTSYKDAVREGFRAALKDPRARLFGEGVTDKYGTYGTTLGLEEEFGSDRVFDVPVAEQLITGLGVGMALGGLRPIVIHPRNDFLLLGLDQLANQAAKWATITGGKVQCPLTIVTVACRGWGAGAQHSQALHATFAQFPGLEISVPFSCPDAWVKIAAAPTSPRVVCLHKWLWNLQGSRDYVLQHQWRSGGDVTLAGISYGVVDCIRAADQLASEGISADVFDIPDLQPLAMQDVIYSAKRTGRLVVVDTGHVAFGASAEIVARVVEHTGWSLGVARIGLPDRPVPANNEQEYFPGPEEVANAARALCES